MVLNSWGIQNRSWSMEIDDDAEHPFLEWGRLYFIHDYAIYRVRSNQWT